MNFAPCFITAASPHVSTYARSRPISRNLRRNGAAARRRKASSMSITVGGEREREPKAFTRRRGDAEEEKRHLDRRCTSMGSSHAESSSICAMTRSSMTFSEREGFTCRTVNVRFTFASSIFAVFLIQLPSASPRLRVNYFATLRRGGCSNGGNSAAGAGGSKSAAIGSFGSAEDTETSLTPLFTSAALPVRARAGVRRLTMTSLSRGFRQGSAASRRPQPYFLNTSSMAARARGSCFWPSQKAAFLRTLPSRCVFINSMSIGTD